MSDAELGYEFTKILRILMDAGYFIARYNATTGKLEPISPHTVIDGEQPRPLPPGGGYVEDDVELSVADAFRFGVLSGASYTGVRMKMSRCRELYPQIMPKFRARGNQTLYRAGDLRAWQEEYASFSKQGRWRRVPRTAEVKQVNPSDGLSMLLGKIRGDDGAA